MSPAIRARVAPVAPRDDRPQRWTAAGATALLHALLLLLALTAEPITMSNPDGAAGGGRIDVSFIDRPQDIPSPPPPEALRPTPRPEPPRPDPAERPDPSRLQVVEVERAEEPLPPEETAAREPAAAPPAPSRRPPRDGRQAWGQPPGMLPEQHAPVNAGPAPSPHVAQGRRYQASSSEPNMEAGGFQVVYDLMAETRLRGWRDAGMTEVFLPLPGVRQLMVCPLETALRRESGPCRLVEPDDPALAGIGDAREVIAMNQVYRRGELVWRGPGPYR